MWREGPDGQHSLAGGILGKGDTIVARNHYHCSSPNLPKVIVIVSDRSDQRVLQHGGEPERQKIGSTVQRLSYTRLHRTEIEQSFVDIKKEYFGSLQRLCIQLGNSGSLQIAFNFVHRCWTRPQN